MTSDILRRAIGGIDAELIENADKAAVKPRRTAWMKWAAAAAAFVIIAVGAFAVLNRQPEKDPYEGVYYRAVEPVDEPVKRNSASSYVDVTKEFIANKTAYIFKGVVQSMKEYEVICVRGEDKGYPKEYTTRVECTVTDPIYGDLNKGEKFYTLYEYSSHVYHAENQVLENGKEYIFIIYKFREDVPQEEIVFDYKRLCPYTLLSSREGFMPVDGDTVRYHSVLGSLGIEGAELNGTIKVYTRHGEVGAYTANYEKVKEKLIQIMEKR